MHCAPLPAELLQSRQVSRARKMVNTLPPCYCSKGLEPYTIYSKPLRFNMELPKKHLYVYCVKYFYFLLYLAYIGLYLALIYLKRIEPAVIEHNFNGITFKPG